MADRAELHLRRRRLRARAAAPLVAAALALGGCYDTAGVEKPSGVALPWITAVANGHTARIGYESDPCTRARRATLESRGSRVVVALYDTERDPKKACVGIVERHCVSFRMDERLGGQEFLDGTKHVRERRELPIERFGPCRPVPVEQDW